MQDRGQNESRKKLLYEKALQAAGRNPEYGGVIPPALLPDL
jgi:hypothetical protein